MKGRALGAAADASSAPTGGCHAAEAALWGDVGASWACRAAEHKPDFSAQLRCRSRSHIFTVPPAEPATTVCSFASRATHSTALWWPVMLAMQFGLPMDQMFTFLSSPPVAMSVPLLRPMKTELTVEACATKSCSLVARCRVICGSCAAITLEFASAVVRTG